MKPFLILFLAALCASDLAARDITFTWDLNPPDENVTSYRLYEIVTAPDSTNYVFLTETPAPPLTIQTDFGPHDYVLTASNFWFYQGSIVGVESGWSNIEPIPAVKPTAPGLEIENDTANNTVSVAFPFPAGQFYVETAADPVGPWGRFVYVAPMGDWQPDKITFGSTAAAESQFWKMTTEALP